MTPRPEVEAVRRADAAFFEALLAVTSPPSRPLLADQFLIVDEASGSVHPRAAFLDAFSGGAVAFQEIKTFPDETVVRLPGPDTGIVVGRTMMSFRSGWPFGCLETPALPLGPPNGDANDYIRRSLRRSRTWPNSLGSMLASDLTARQIDPAADRG